MTASRRWRLPPRRVILSLAAAASLGVAAVVAPVLFDPTIKRYDAPLFPLIRTAVEGFHGTSLLLLVAAGYVVGMFGVASPITIGLATMATFPVLSAAEMIVDPTSHTLWPFEWLLYAFGAIPGTVGAYLGQRFHGDELPKEPKERT